MLEPGQHLHGFEVVSIDDLTEYRARGVRARHLATGCEVYHVANDDPENLFAFAFKTVPSSSNGIAHILEHTVLCGSRRYPLKDPFLLLLQGSMSTFMNAFTFPDKTVYPAASTVAKDLFNIMQVYGDAVFRPLLRPEMFRQEGHRLEFAEDGELQRSGVVYNEMKGNYASHDSIAAEWSYRSLMPDTPYAVDSGGDPAVIPSLSYEEFLEFHRRYYHPSNTRVFLYGDIPTERYLEALQSEFLTDFEALEPRNELPEQPRWSESRRMQDVYPLEQGEETDRKSSVTLNWLPASNTDPELTLAFEILAEILLGHSGSPLQKVIVESPLGEDLSAPSGLETELRELVFSVGMRGTDPEKRDAIEELVLGELQRLWEEGIEAELVEGALRRVEFRNREIKTGASFALRLMRRSLRGWLHGCDPVATLEFTPLLRRLRERLEREPNLFERLIKSHLLDNPHRSTVTIRPEPGLDDRRREQERVELDERAASLGEAERAAIEAEQKALRALQEEPDDPDRLAELPFLTKEDIPREIERIAYRRRELEGVPVYLQEEFTNGIVYLDFAFRIDDLQPEFQLLLPLLSDAITECGLPGMSYDHVARELALKTGGFSANIDVSAVLVPDAAEIPGGLPRNVALGEAEYLSEDDPRRRPAAAFLTFRLKALEAQFDEALALVQRLLREAELTNTKRVRELLLESRNDLQSAVLPGGHQFAALRSARTLSPALELSERWRGITQLRFLAELDLDGALEELSSVLLEIRDRTVARSRSAFSLTCAAEFAEQAERALSALLRKLPAEAHGSRERAAPSILSEALDRSAADPLARGGRGTQPEQAPEAQAFDTPGFDTPGFDTPGFELFSVPSGVAYVAGSVPGSVLGSSEYPAEQVLAHALSTGFLWERVRMQGGAYGVTAMPRALEGVFSFASYRDPNIVSTLEAFADGLRRHAEGERAEGEREERAVELAIIGSVSRELRPLMPAQKGVVNLQRLLYGIPDELRQERRDRMIRLTAADLSAAARRLLERWSRPHVAVIAGGGALTAAAEEDPRFAIPHTELPL